MSQPNSLYLGDVPLINNVGGFAEQITPAENAASLDLDRPGRVFVMQITSTAAFTLNVNNLAIGPGWASADLFIRTTAVPASFTFAGNAVGIQVAGRTLAANPFAAGSISRVRLMKQTEGRYLIEFDPATAAA
jgi:hypothetical protein